MTSDSVEDIACDPPVFGSVPSELELSSGIDDKVSTDVSKSAVFVKEAVEENTGSEVWDSTVKMTVLETITRLELTEPTSDVKELGKTDRGVSEAEN